MPSIRDISAWVLGNSSGSIRSGDFDIASITSGIIASGHVGTHHFTSGLSIPIATQVTPAYSTTTVPAGNTIANTTAETAFTSSYTILANTLSVGDVIRIHAWGVYGTTVVAPTIIGRVRMGGVGGVQMVSTGTITSVAGATNAGWKAEVDMVVQSIGASGTIEAHGFLSFESAATAALAVHAKNTAALTVDTTANQAIVMTVAWGTADVLNTVTLRLMTVEILKKV